MQRWKGIFVFCSNEIKSIFLIIYRDELLYSLLFFFFFLFFSFLIPF